MVKYQIKISLITKVKQYIYFNTNDCYVNVFSFYAYYLFFIAILELRNSFKHIAKH